MSQLQIRKDNYAITRLLRLPNPEKIVLAADEILVAIDKFAYSANNITYAVVGEMMGYWNFFPTVEDEQNEWGVIPVWGFAEVLRSEVDEIKIGERLFGYFPLASYLIMKPGAVTDHKFIDTSEHRSTLPPTYNLYQRMSAEITYDASTDRFRMLLYPLFITAFCLCDLLERHNYYGAEQIIVLSASSKTSLGLAIGLHSSASKVLVGITSEKNKAFVEQLNLHKQVYSYKDLESVDSTKSTVIIDMSGNGTVLKSLSDHLGEQLQYRVSVGLTHWDQQGISADQNQVNGTFFFAPEHMQACIKDWGYTEFERRSSAFLKNAIAHASTWLRFEELRGLEALEQIHPDVCAGNMDPSTGLIVKV